MDRVVVPARERGQRDGPHARLAVARAAEQRQLRARDRRRLEQRGGRQTALERLRALHREHVDREPARERRLEVRAQRLGREIAQVRLGRRHGARPGRVQEEAHQVEQVRRGRVRACRVDRPHEPRVADETADLGVRLLREHLVSIAQALQDRLETLERIARPLCQRDHGRDRGRAARSESAGRLDARPEKAEKQRDHAP